MASILQSLVNGFRVYQTFLEKKQLPFITTFARVVMDAERSNLSKLADIVQVDWL
jgi:hypothetical protein